MELNDGEKLILYMLTEIYQKLGIRGDVDPDFVQSAICDGNLWSLKWKHPGIFEPKEPKDGVIEEVVDFLDMWSFIESSYKRISATDKTDVLSRAGLSKNTIKFSGFDGNSEGDYLSVARCLIEKLDRWAEFKKRDLNSHTPYSVETYRRLYRVFEPIRRESHGKAIGADQLVEILREHIHPSRR